MFSLIEDVRYGFRMLTKRPRLTLAPVLTPTLGIGASTVVYSWTQAVLFHPLGATHFLTHQLYGIQSDDPVTFAVVTATLCGVAILACWFPARRATKVDPMAALRHE